MFFGPEYSQIAMAKNPTGATHQKVGIPTAWDGASFSVMTYFFTKNGIMSMKILSNSPLGHCFCCAVIKNCREKFSGKSHNL